MVAPNTKAEKEKSIKKVKEEKGTGDKRIKK